MSFLMQCPYCATNINLPDRAENATCPNCFRNFPVVHTVKAFTTETTTGPEEAAASFPNQATGIKWKMRQLAGKPAPASRDAEKDSAVTSPIGPWGVFSFAVAALALLSASLIGVRTLTVMIAALGLAIFLLGLQATWQRGRTKDGVWLVLGGGVNVVVLALTLFAPGVLNNHWALDFAVPIRDPNKQEVVGRHNPLGPRKPLASDAWATAPDEWILQDDALIRLESVEVAPMVRYPEMIRIGTSADKGKGAPFLLVYFRLGVFGHVRPITFEGFNDKHKLNLTDDAGRHYRLVELLPRIIRGGAPAVFDPQAMTVQTIAAPRYKDYLLVFEAPPEGVETFKLELPASAWGRKGICKFRISRFFEATLPYEPKEGKQ